MTLSRFGNPRVFTLFFSLFLSTSIFSEDNFDTVSITADHVAGKVWMLMGERGNIAVSLGDDGVLMVDDQFAPLAGKIRDAITELGGVSPVFLLNTHFHGDHSGGNEAFADTATIIAHDNVRLRMALPDNGRVPEALPVITYAHSMSIHFNGEEIRLIHLPDGHTDGDSAIWFAGSGVLHMGDQFFAVRFPFVDTANGGTIAGLIKNLDTILAQLPTTIRIIPGHGELAGREDFARYVAGVKDTVAIATRKIEAGATLDMLIADGLPGRYADWGNGFISEQAWLTTIFDSYRSSTSAN